MLDYCDPCDMAALFFERNDREPTDDELALFMAEYPVERADFLHDQERDRGIP